MNICKQLKVCLGAFLFALLHGNAAWSQSGNVISQDRDGVTFTFEFNCNNGPCRYGTFVTGDYWVVPSTPDGVVTITAITPTGEENGAMVNPDLLRDGDNALLDKGVQKQGILPMYDHYRADLNLMNELPYQATGNESIFKVKSQTSGCGTRGIADGCVSTATVLTVLSEPPLDNGSKTFRPPFHGGFKPLFTTDKLKMDRLPALPQLTTNYEELLIETRQWLSPQIELYHSGLGEFHRATIPHLAQTPYAADQAMTMLEQISGTFASGDIPDKEACLLPIIQKGIDNYGVFKMGVPFSSGAGQHLGKKPPLALFAALYDDRELLEEIRAIALDESYQDKLFFQEDAQIRMGPEGMAVWGDFDPTFESIHWYFSRLYPRLDGNGTLGDPYRYIDGPAGGIYPDENETDDRNYINVAGGPLISYAFLQHLMPWYKYAAGDPELLLWSDRIYKGYGIEDFDGGLWTVPDPVAPYDTNESGCKPFKMYSTGITDCNNYGVTWGPNLDDPAKFIPHNGDPFKDGRMPELHGHKIAFNRLIDVVENHWDDLRSCADPTHPDYPCSGLGSELDFSPTDPEDNVLGVDLDESALVTITKSGSTLNFEVDQRVKRFEIAIYSINGKRVFSKQAEGNEIRVSLHQLLSVQRELLIYHIVTDDSAVAGKLMSDW